MWNLDEKDLFRKFALGAMRSNTRIDAPEMFLDAAIAQFMADEEKPVAEEAARFNSWIQTIEYHVKRYDPHELAVGLSLPAGQGFINLDLRANLLTYNADGQVEEITQESLDVSAVGMLKLLISSYVAVADAAKALKLDGAARPTDGASSGGTSEVTTEDFDAESLEVGTWQRRKTYRIRAGWFRQFGAAVYEETLKKCGYGHVIDLPVGTMQPFLHKITVQTKDGKPKVVSISA